MGFTGVSGGLTSTLPRALRRIERGVTRAIWIGQTILDLSRRCRGIGAAAGRGASEHADEDELL